MTQNAHTTIRELIDRISRIAAAGEWQGAINPTQRAALAYLARANRFSRAPSMVADYLSATRGTVSQTLKTLSRKGLVEEQRSENDRRSISYEVTEAGQAELSRTDMDAGLAGLRADEAELLAELLRKLASGMLEARGGRSFGICRTCRFHRLDTDGRYCTLLKTPLLDTEAEQICAEYSNAG